jgi:glycosyltransferase involved in cell wall biosynthesis
LGLRKRKVVISNGIDLSEFSDLPLRSKLRERYPELKDKKIILFLGRIDRIKGLDILVKAYSIIAKKSNEAHLFIAGDGEGGYKERVEQEVINLGLQKRVTFSGFLNSKERLEAYMGSDIFILPSYSENFGLSAVEAMACALPVVISDRVGICREVKDKNSGIIVETNAESVYHGLKKLLEDEGLRKELSENGKLIVREYYDIDKVADKMIKVFKETSSERPV